jgi:hypothetical protein
MVFDKAAHQVEVRQKFDALNAKVAEIRAVSTPLREKRDEVVRGHRVEEAALNAEIAKVEDGLFGIEQERAMWARQLSGNQSVSAEPMTRPAAPAA